MNGLFSVHAFNLKFDITHLSIVHATKDSEYEIDLIEKLLTKVPNLLIYKDRFRRNALNIATKKQHETLVQLLLSKFGYKMDLFCRDDNVLYPVNYACMFDNLKIYKMYLPWITAENIDQLELYHLCAQYGAVRVAKFILANNPRPNINYRNARDATALHLAVERGENGKIIKMYLDAGADVLIQSGGLDNSLHGAVNVINDEAIKMVATHSTAAINQLNPAQVTSLEWLSTILVKIEGKSKTASVLIAYGADPFMKNHQGLTFEFGLEKREVGVDGGIDEKSDLVFRALRGEDVNLSSLEVMKEGKPVRKGRKSQAHDVDDDYTDVYD
ncbi:hypothetical protein HK098_006404 [Nowakowskiella sp. JEL0407]|nr:hypothetical protein HK098_006404 [Nowakowskiella sp. JEL0407]